MGSCGGIFKFGLKFGRFKMGQVPKTLMFKIMGRNFIIGVLIVEIVEISIWIQPQYYHWGQGHWPSFIIKFFT